MSISRERSKNILSYLAGGHSKPSRTSSASKRQNSSEKPRSESRSSVDERHQANYASRKTKTDKPKSHHRHKTSRSVDVRPSYRDEPKSQEAGSQLQRQVSFFDDEDCNGDQGKERSFFSRAVSYVDERRYSHASDDGRSSVDEQTSPPTPRTREPTLEDAKKHHIGPGRCLKHWDPEEEPILLLTSVFDANSLGKWVLDQTAHIYGEHDDMSDLAADFWFEHIKLGGKLKQAKGSLLKIADPSVRHRVKEFILFGDRLVNELDQKLKKCEERVLEVTGISEMPKLGRKTIVVFIDTFIGRSPAQREAFDDFTRSMREWNIWFDTSCASLLR
ncbi:hypothetical protein diail_7186 [Diaporthe ilicicola]|nr:hypothetical protein diail_7186 [Diaporthe ilicicola]